MAKRLLNKLRSGSKTPTTSTPQQPEAEPDAQAPLGWYILAEGVDPKIDIVAIHGLNGHRDRTWTAPNGVNWLRDLLPLALPNARIITWGYDANTHSSSCVSQQTIYDHATSLVSDLRLKRELTETSRRPIIFIAHSLGGLVVKSALIHADAAREGHLKEHRSIKLSTYGIVFMGTPHQGGNGVSLGQLAVNIASLFMPANGKVLQHLERDSEWLQQQIGQYAPISNDFVTKFCYEEYRTPTFLNQSIVVVPRSSAVIPGAVNAEPIVIHANHRDMVRFSSQSDSGYQTVSGHLQLMVKDACLKVEERWNKESRIDNALTDKYIEPTSVQNEKWLKMLPVASEAAFNAYETQYNSLCLENTRTQVLEEIKSWADGEDERRIYWLYGLAGTGKSTIARTIAYEYSNRHRLGASFFFSKGGGDVGHAKKFFTTVAFQLGAVSPHLQTYISQAVSENNDVLNQSLRDQWRKLILQPLSRLKDNSNLLLVIDALDECEGDNDISTIIQQLVEVKELKSVRLRIFLVSRPEIAVRYGFSQISETEHKDFVLHNIPPAVVDVDILTFFEHNLRTIRQEFWLNNGWPGDQTVGSLVEHASGLFIWASTACRFIREGKQFAPKRLDSIVSRVSRSTNAPEKHLNMIYLAVLEKSVSPSFMDEEKVEMYSLLRQILGCLAVLFSPLSTRSLTHFLSIPPQSMRLTLDGLYAILEIPHDEDRPLRLHHPSFRDFLLDKTRCDDPNFWVDENSTHLKVVGNCLKIMSESLKQDICGVMATGTLVDDMDENLIKQNLSPQLQYACCYWVQHLQRSGAYLSDEGDDQVHRFLKVHLLHWIEALGWMQKLFEGIHAITLLESVALRSKCPNLSTFIRDSKRFLLYSRFGIERAPLQVYCSALLFAPAKSLVKAHFQHQQHLCIRRSSPVADNWSGAWQTLEGHAGEVFSVAISPDNNVLASGSEDNTVKLWDATTGAVLHTLEGHSGAVTKVVFSSDPKTLASCSDDRTIKLWDTQTGAEIRTIDDNCNSGCNITFSQDGKTLAFSSYGGKHGQIQMWNVDLGTAARTLDGHSLLAHTLAFSPDSKLLASGAYDNTIKLWDVATGALIQAFENQPRIFEILEFSPNGAIVAASLETDIIIWDASTKNDLVTLASSSDWATALAFSSTEVLASGSQDGTVKLWGRHTGVQYQNLEGHLSSVNSVFLSSDGKILVSGSRDRTVRLWDISSRPLLQPLESIQATRESIVAIALSQDGKILASSSQDQKTIKLWDTTGQLLKVIRGHSLEVKTLTFAPNSQVLASGSDDTTIRLWSSTGEPAGQRRVLRRSVLEGHLDLVSALVFSSSSNFLASGSRDHTVRLWDAQKGIILHVLKGDVSWVYFVALSVDDHVAVSGSGKMIELWDSRTGALLKKLQGHPGNVDTVALSPNGNILALGSNDCRLMLWDINTDAELQAVSLRVPISKIDWPDETMLQTNRGVVRMSSTVDLVTSSQTRSNNIFVGDQWIYWGLERILWIPFEYRSHLVEVRGNIVAIGRFSGQPFFLEFDLSVLQQRH